MELRFSWDEETRIYRVEGDPGMVLSLDAILAVDRALLEQVGDPAGIRVLYDMRGVDTSALQGSDFEMLARRNAEVWKQATGGRAVVLTGAAVSYGQARQYEMLSEPHRARAFAAFTDYEAALAWLHAEEPRA